MYSIRKVFTLYRRHSFGEEEKKYPRHRDKISEKLIFEHQQTAVDEKLWSG